MSLGKMFMSAILAEGSVSSLIQFGAIEHLFRGNEVEAYSFVREFVKSYGKLPDPDTIEAHTGETLVKHKETPAYYFDLMEARFTEFALKKAMKEASDHLLPENKDPEAALKVVVETAMKLMGQKHSRQVVDLREAYDLLIADYVSKIKGVDGYGLRLGWPTLDKMSGGLVKGDVISFVGRPAAGKTWQMLFGAHHGWSTMGKKVDPDHDQSRMFVSMEMSILPIQQRLAALQMHLPMTQLQQAALSSKNLKKLKDGLVEIKGYGAPFYVVDGNLTATVEDIWMMARQLNPAAIFVDGAYLVKHPKERDRYKRVAENADLIKKELAAIAPVCCSWQFARSAADKNQKKKKDGNKVGLEDIGYTDAIGQVSSLVLGVFEEESVETLKQRRIEVLKGRNGEVGSFLTRWDFDKMDFTEIEPQTVDKMQFI